jgi:hypothetical protein
MRTTPSEISAYLHSLHVLDYSVDSLYAYLLQLDDPMNMSTIMRLRITVSAPVQIDAALRRFEFAMCEVGDSLARDVRFLLNHGNRHHFAMMQLDLYKLSDYIADFSLGADDEQMEKEGHKSRFLYNSPELRLHTAFVRSFVADPVSCNLLIAYYMNECK